MTKFEQIQHDIELITPIFKVEDVLLADSYNRILQQDIIVDMDMPPFDKSAMDGYACRMDSLKNELKVIEIIPAGVLPAKPIGTNQCSKIMTGAAVPNGANCVFKVEDADQISETSVRCQY